MKMGPRFREGDSCVIPVRQDVNPATQVVIPAKAGIQQLYLGPRFREGDLQKKSPGIKLGLFIWPPAFARATIAIICSALRA